MDAMSLVWIAVCVFIVWYVIEDWDHDIPPGFDEALRNAEREHGKKDEDEE